MSAKRRKPGEWISISASRRNKPADLVNGHGVSNVPRITDVGSAAYRRLIAGTQKRGK